MVEKTIKDYLEEKLKIIDFKLKSYGCDYYEIMDNKQQKTNIILFNDWLSLKHQDNVNFYIKLTKDNVNQVEKDDCISIGNQDFFILLRKRIE